MRETTTNPMDSALAGLSSASSRLDAVKALAKAGFHLLIIEPGTKDPVDMRTPGERRSDVKRDPRLEAGGLWTATDDVKRLEKYWARAVEKFGQEPNVGVHVEWSGLVTIDADQAHETEDVQRLGLEGQNVPPAAYTPTVTSPGAVKDGQWIHSGGGHFHYLADVDELPLVGEFKLPGGAVVSTTGRYYLIPPSVRDEGPYTVTGPLRRLSQAPWLVELLRRRAQEETVERTRRVEKAAERKERRERSGPSTVEAWNDGRAWVDILPEYEWEPAQKTDKCGCAIWTAPGVHDSPKSATAHEAGCENPRVELEGGSGPLHIWTSSRPPQLEGKDRWSKAQFVAAMKGQTMGQFVVAEGLVETIPHPADMVLGVMPETEETFWTSYPALTRLRDFARARRAAPWATLGAALALVSAAIPSYVVLPPLVGRRGSLNYYVGIVAPPGGGKGTSTGAALEALTGLPDVTMNEAGSGEGLVRAYGMKKRNPTDLNTYVLRESFLVDVPEIESMYSVTGRQGATFSAVFRKGWSGELLGFQYADSTKAAVIPAMAYRLSAIVGIQPLLSGPFLGEHAGGLPQRFVYLAATDPGFTREHREELMARLGDGPLPTVDMSHLKRDFPPLDPFRIPVTDDDADESDGPTAGEPTLGVWRPLRDDEYREVKVCRSAIEAVDAETESRLALSIDTMLDPEAELNGHRTMLQLKTAAILSAFVGEGGDVTEEVWALSGILLAKSDQTVGLLRSALRKYEDKQEKARGRREAARDVARNEAAAEHSNKYAETAKTRIWEYLQDGEAKPLRPLRDRFKTGPHRDTFTKVLEDLIEDGLVDRFKEGRAVLIKYVGTAQ